MDKDSQYRLTNAEKQQAYPAAPVMAIIGLAPAADRQACSSLRENPKARLEVTQSQSELAR